MAEDDIPEEVEAVAEAVAEDEEPEKTPRHRDSEPFGLGLVLFVLGICVGFPLAVIGSDFLTRNAGLIITFILIFVTFFGLLGITLLMLRRRILGFLFNLSATTLEQFAKPLSDTTRHIVARQSAAAVDSAEELAKLMLARWAWVSTRRWLIGSLTGLLAALAALAGTALLFRQNELLAVQLVRLDQQNDLLKTQTQLGEAQRSAAILPSLLDINADLAKETAALAKDGRGVAIYDLTELSDGLRGRMIAATLGARPYRYLQGGSVDERDMAALKSLAMARRPEILAESAKASLNQQVYETRLIDRPVSPERGIIIALLHAAGIHQTEDLSFYGADFSFAEVRLPVVNLMSFTFARLRFADFSWSTLNSVVFGAADLSHARFRNTVLSRCDFSGLTADQVKPPYKGVSTPALSPTTLDGVDFSRSFIVQSRFAHVEGLAANFDDTVLIEPDFADASIAGSTFRNAILIRPKIAGANLKAIDLDGAFVFEADFLGRLGKEAATDERGSTFKVDRYSSEPVDFDTLGQHPLAARLAVALETVEVGDKVFRLKRVGEFR